MQYVTITITYSYFRYVPTHLFIHINIFIFPGCTNSSIICIAYKGIGTVRKYEYLRESEKNSVKASAGFIVPWGDRTILRQSRAEVLPLYD